MAGRLGGMAGGLLNRSLDQIIQQQRQEEGGRGGSGKARKREEQQEGEGPWAKSWKTNLGGAG